MTTEIHTVRVLTGEILAWDSNSLSHRRICNQLLMSTVPLPDPRLSTDGVRQNCRKMKEIGPRGRVPNIPLGSANGDQ